jgi:hypothetical protein
VGLEESDPKPATALTGRLVALCLLALITISVSYYTNAFTTWDADDGLSYVPTTDRSLVKVTDASGPAARAGVRAGDLIERSTLPLFVTGTNTSPARHVTIVRDGATLDVHIEPVVTPLGWSLTGRFLSEVWTVLFALLIALRAKRWPFATPLALILALSALADTLFEMALPIPELSYAVQVVGALGTPLTFVLLTRYFAAFGQPLTVKRRFWTRVAYGAAALSVLATLNHMMLWVFWLVPAARIATEFEIFELALTSPIVPCFVCGVLASRAAAPADAQRVGWIAAAYGFFWTFWLLAGPFGIVWSSLHAFGFVWQVETASHVLVPLILSYAALSKRLFDVGFLVSRTVVFSVLSVIVVGCFVLLEWSIEKWFEDANHTTSLTLNAALALGLGLSMRFLHHRVDGVVDRVFFRKRHENERALRRFAHEAAFITSPDVLLDRTVVEIGDHSEASFAKIRLAGDLPPNDPAVLALQAWREPIDLTGYRSALSGEYAFPMLAHNEFAGAILCGEKKNGERYAPDEIETLKEVARGVAIALRGLGFDGARHDVMVEILAKVNAIEARLSANGGSTRTPTPYSETP